MSLIVKGHGMGLVGNLIIRCLGGETGRIATIDTFTLWCYAGPPAQVDGIALALLGIAD